MLSLLSWRIQVEIVNLPAVPSRRAESQVWSTSFLLETAMDDGCITLNWGNKDCARACACMCVCARTPEFSFASAECKRTVIHTGGTTEEFLRISLRQKAFDWKLGLKTCLVNNHVTFTWLNFLQSQGLQSEQRSCSGLLACSLFRVNWE